MGIEFILGVKLLSFNLVAALPILELKGLELKGVGFPLVAFLILEELEFDSGSVPSVRVSLLSSAETEMFYLGPLHAGIKMYSSLLCFLC